MKVLVSAYACEPGTGSEPGAGWEWTRAAARAGHQVWVVTRENNKDMIEAALADEPDLKINPVYLDLPQHLRRWKKGQRGIRLYYVLWQRAARDRMRALHREVGFDVAHHVTFATDWLPAAATAVPGLPSVWGPVGGSTPMALPLYRFLGVKGTFDAFAREVVGRAGRATWGRASASRAAITVALNHDVANRFASLSPTVVVEPNSAFDTEWLRADAVTSPHGTAGSDERHRAVLVGRLTPWKGVMLALAALAHPLAARWGLDIYGDGPDRRRLAAAIAKRGLTDRVSLRGQASRPDVLRAMSGADALLHPAFHDSSPWTVGEAVTLGVPVVCLDAGGPPTLAAPGRVEVVTVGRRIVQEVAGALQRLETPGPAAAGSDRWSTDRLPAFLDEVYATAAQRSSSNRSDQA